VNRDQAVEKLELACPVAFSGEPVIAAYLHGSVALGRPGPFSDVDVAALLTEPVRDPLGAAVGLGGKLREASGIPNLDLRVLNGTTLRFQGEVLRDGRLVYSTDEPARVAYHVYVLKRYLDSEIHGRELRAAFLERTAQRRP
jgi:predicted nucleotidyltransferase